MPAVFTPFICGQHNTPVKRHILRTLENRTACRNKAARGAVYNAHCVVFIYDNKKNTDNQQYINVKTLFFYTSGRIRHTERFQSALCRLYTDSFASPAYPASNSERNIGIRQSKRASAQHAGGADSIGKIGAFNCGGMCAEDSGRQFSLKEICRWLILHLPPMASGALADCKFSVCRRQSKSLPSASVSLADGKFLTG